MEGWRIFAAIKRFSNFAFSKIQNPKVFQITLNFFEIWKTLGFCPRFFAVLIDRRTETIISTELFNGKAHDLTIFKQTTSVKPLILIIADSGYRGLQKSTQTFKCQCATKSI